MKHDLPDSPETYDAVLAVLAGVAEGVLARLTPEGLTVRTEAFTALIGDPAGGGDENGEPILTLRG